MSDLSPELAEDFVYYCKRCHSLKILVDESLACDGWDGSYCGKCNSTDIGTCHIDDWLEVEEMRRKEKERIEWSR